MLGARPSAGTVMITELNLFSPYFLCLPMISVRMVILEYMTSFKMADEICEILQHLQCYPVVFASSPVNLSPQLY